ncbi:MAG: hypothetical protein JWQ21_1056 [Herminiimonas sp.]|jgi:hypothetical protein|nr:hypothetical protein [Herminiimonas sp.]
MIQGVCDARRSCVADWGLRDRKNGSAALPAGEPFTHANKQNLREI